MPQQPRLLIFAGAGVSVDSGLPTFRVAEGASSKNGNVTMWGTEDVEDVCSYGKWRAASHSTKRGSFDKLFRIHNFYKNVQDSIKDAEPKITRLFWIPLDEIVILPIVAAA